MSTRGAVRSTARLNNQAKRHCNHSSVQGGSNSTSKVSADRSAIPNSCPLLGFPPETNSTPPFEQLFQSIAEIAAQRQPRSILENHGVIAVKQRLKFLDPVQVHNHRPADAHEPVGSQMRFQPADG